MNVVSKDPKVEAQIQQAVETIAEAVGSTMGPNGATVMFRDRAGKLVISKDGISVLNSIQAGNDVESMILDLMKQAAGKAVAITGDGTTTTTLLTGELYTAAIRALTSTVSTEPKRAVVKQLTKYVNDVTAEIESIARPVTTVEQLRAVALTSGNGDTGIADLIEQSFVADGEIIDSFVTVKQSTTLQDTVTVDKGMVLNLGFVSPYFVNDHATHTMSYTDIRAIVLNGEFNIEQFNMINKAKPIVVFCTSLTKEAVDRCAREINTKVSTVVPIKVHGFGERQLAILQDVAVFLNISSSESVSGIEEYSLLTSIEASKDKTVFSVDVIPSEKDTRAKNIKERIENLKNVMAVTDESFEMKKLNERISALNANVVTITLAAYTDIELKERFDRLEDVLGSVKSAISGGYIWGKSKDMTRASVMTNSPFSGCTAKLYAKLNNGDAEVKEVTTAPVSDDGYRILDAALVATTALKSAASVVRTLLTTEHLLIRINDGE